MPTDSKTLLCHYEYDPLDRLVDCTVSGQESARRFYHKDRLATEIHSAVKRSIMQHDDQLLAQQRRQIDAVETSLLATDQQRTVLNALAASGPQPIAHTPYGHRPIASGLLSLLGFNGERPDPVTGCYLLGNGYRAFNPVLMRFNSPDSWSPFGKGGINAYAYCVGDPVNTEDPTGHFKLLKSLLKGIGNQLNLRTSKTSPFQAPLAGTYKKTEQSGLAPNTLHSSKHQNESTFTLNPGNDSLMNNGATPLEKETLLITISTRRILIKSVLSQHPTTTPEHEVILRATANHLDRQLMDAEKKLNSLKKTPDTNRSIRTNSF